MKISDLPVLNDAKGNAYIPVVDPDETDPALQNKRIYLSTLSAAVENFTPYDPAVEYSATSPDFASYNGNVYEYIYPTPSTGNVPTNATYWRLVSAGQFNHIQNTDTHTTSRIYELGKLTGTLLDPTTGDPIEEPTGSVVFVFGRANDNARKTAIREFWETVEGAKQYHLQFCLDYTGTGSDVWRDFGGSVSVTVDNGTTIIPADADGVIDISEPIFDKFHAQLSEHEINPDAHAPIVTTGTTLLFDDVRGYIHGTPAVPETGNIVLTVNVGSKTGTVNKLFHNSGAEPPINGLAIGNNTGVAKRLAGTYVTGALNIFHFSHDFGVVGYTISQYT